MYESKEISFWKQVNMFKVTLYGKTKQNKNKNKTPMQENAFDVKGILWVLIHIQIFYLW